MTIIDYLRDALKIAESINPGRPGKCSNSFITYIGYIYKIIKNISISNFFAIIALGVGDVY